MGTGKTQFPRGWHRDFWQRLMWLWFEGWEILSWVCCCDAQNTTRASKWAVAYYKALFFSLLIHRVLTFSPSILAFFFHFPHPFLFFPSLSLSLCLKFNSIQSVGATLPQTQNPYFCFFIFLKKLESWGLSLSQLCPTLLHFLWISLFSMWDFMFFVSLSPHLFSIYSRFATSALAKEELGPVIPTVDSFCFFLTIFFGWSKTVKTKQDLMLFPFKFFPKSDGEEQWTIYIKNKKWGPRHS